jgi:hypothetical protein
MSLPVYTYQPASVHQFVTDCEGAPENDAKWAGGTRQEAIDALLHGHAPTTAAVRRIVDELECLAPAVAPATCYDVTGDAPDIGRYLSGEPECMLSWTTEEQLRILSVELMLAYGGDTRALMAARAGAVSAAIVDRLESSGYRVELSVRMATEHAPRYGASEECIAEVVVPIKRACDPLSIDLLSAMLAYIPVFRQVFISIIDKHNHGMPMFATPKRFSTACGVPITASDRDNRVPLYLERNMPVAEWVDHWTRSVLLYHGIQA